MCEYITKDTKEKHGKTVQIFGCFVKHTVLHAQIYFSDVFLRSCRDAFYRCCLVRFSRMFLRCAFTVPHFAGNIPEMYRIMPCVSYRMLR
jgi:hypothetical protein